ncbi:MAG: MopE-related protein, partial [Myxococcota bacterium]|nr:MopE-related protein [Myxococcota bacterium]
KAAIQEAACNQIDDDCDGDVDILDDECAQPCVDADFDGYDDAACGGDDCDDNAPAVNPGMAEDCGNGIDDDCDGDADGADDDCVQATTIADVQPIFTNSCAVGGCHDANHPLGLDLQAGVAYGNTVGVPANQPPAMDRVLEFAPPLSYLIHKINNSHLAVGGVGQQMPVGLSISPADIVAIVTWIEDGALP